MPPNYVINNCNLCILSCHVGQYSFDCFFVIKSLREYIQSKISREKLPSLYNLIIRHSPCSQFVKILTQNGIFFCIKI